MSRLSCPFLSAVALCSFIATYNAVQIALSHTSHHSPSLIKDWTSRKIASSSQEAPLLAVVPRPESAQKATKPSKRLFHVVTTVDSRPYGKWQTRIHYYWYKQMRDREGSEMGGFTRVLHSGVPDDLMDEIPTMVVDPLPAGMDKGYVVLNRPWAFVQWIQRANIPEEYIMMAEPDHIFLKPLPNLASEHMPAAFPFFYIDPKKHEEILRRFYPKELGEISNIDPIGNSPVIIKKAEFAKLAPVWHNVTLALKSDPEADKTFGWVLEMYGYAVASALLGYQHILRRDFMIQPPFDTAVGDAHLIHYTYGCDYNLKGELTYGTIGQWRFDKRTYSNRPPPRSLPMPPLGVAESVVTLVKMVNEATANIPGWGDS